MNFFDDTIIQDSWLFNGHCIPNVHLVLFVVFMAIHVGLRHPHTKHSTFPITQLYWRFHATCRRKKVGDESTRSAALMTNRQFSTCFRTLLFSNTKWAILMRFEWKWIGCTFGWLMNSNCNADNNDKKICLPQNWPGKISISWSNNPFWEVS